MSPKNMEEELSQVGNILNAAQKRFGQYGLCKTTMSEIATDIGLSKAALYYYYPDKESLFEAVIAKEQKEFIEEVAAMVKPGVKLGPLLIGYVKRRQDYYERFMNLSKLTYESISSSKPLLMRLSEELTKKEFALVGMILENGIANKEFRKINVHDYSTFLVSMLQGLRVYSLKMQAGHIKTEEEQATLDHNLKMAIQMFIKDISIS